MPTKAEKLLFELRTLPKIINQLQLDIQRLEATTLSSPQWSDMRVNGGLMQTQEDKNIAIVEGKALNEKQILINLKRKEHIMNLLNQIEDSVQRHLLLTTYLNCETYDEAMDVLGMSRNTYYAIKRKAVASLEEILKYTEIY